MNKKPTKDQHAYMATYFQEYAAIFAAKAARRQQSYNKELWLEQQTRAEVFYAFARYHVWRLLYPDAPHEDYDA